MATKTKAKTRGRNADQEAHEVQAELVATEERGNGGNGEHEKETHEVRAEPVATEERGKDSSEKQEKETGGKPVYAHPTNKRCPRCRGVMRTLGTRRNGRIKRWQCTAPICRATAKTFGTVA